MKNFIRSRKFLMGASLVGIVAALAVGQVAFHQNIIGSANAQAAADVMVPVFEADPLWPKPLPNGWIIGQTIGLAADKQDNVWIVHRPGSLEEKEVYQTRKQGDCCTAAPDVLEFSPTGDLLHHWGKVAGHDWPSSNHGITVDDQGNVWLGANGGGQPPAYAPGSQAQFDAARGARGARAQAANVTSGSAPEPTGGTACTRGEYHDSFMLKFTQDGKFLGEIGKANGSRGSLDKDNVCGVATIKFIPGTNELIAADGYGNHRVSVWDPVTMKIKRIWGAYGKPPTDLVIPHYNVNSPQFGNPVHCAMPSNDGLVYVCDRTNNRMQVFKTDGSFVKQYTMETNTRGDGSVWEVAFSRDAAQKFMYISDGSNEKIHVYDRASMKELYSFGGGGRQPGQFYAVHSVVTDSKGNIYTTETYRGQRVQKFTYKGLQSLSALMKKGASGNSLIYAPPKN